ncbi:hypothetical protein [Anderseniella sp. Alg231-50]|uniref:hypothetical protein n=1 Tax=Anderseniella sp. Alg231-50 TaxID=1922226 RepID=UPI000D555EC2
MQHDTEITIANDLDVQNMQRASDLPCAAVLDIRFTAATGARPVEEEVLLRLRNLQVDYEQLPIDLSKPHGWQKNDLMRRITEGRGRMMVITDQPEAVSAFCRDIEVPEAHFARDAQTAVPAVPHQHAPQPGTAGFQRSAAA